MEERSPQAQAPNELESAGKRAGEGGGEESNIGFNGRGLGKALHWVERSAKHCTEK